MGRLIDLTGQRFGRLVVIIKSNRRKTGGSVRWICKCDCGKIKEISSQSLKQGETKSCGCYQKEILKKRVTKYSTRESFLVALFNRYKTDAKNRNIYFDLELKDFSDLIQLYCIYCGSIYTNILKTTRGEFYYTGIDRVNNTKGYIKGNVVSCCKICNQAKLTLTLKEFNEWRQQMVNHVNKNGL